MNRRGRKRRSLESQQIQQVQLDNSVEENAGSKICDNATNFLEILNKTLLTQYTNVAHRLKIRDIPKCLINPANCKEHHCKNEVKFYK